jgi:PAS domain S-box-containing protein
MNLRESEKNLLLLELLDCTEDLALVLDGGLRILTANRAAVILFGYQAVDLTTKHLADLIDIDDRGKMEKLVHDARGRLGGATTFLTHSGEKLPARFSLSALSDEGEEPTYFLLVIHRTKGDSAIRNADASNGLATRMRKGFSEPLFIIDGPSRTVRDCNEAAVNATGYSHEELIGRRLLDHTKDAEAIRQYRAAEVRADRTYATAGIFQERLLFPRKDAPPMLCDLIGLPFLRPDGSLDIVIATLHDRSAEEAREIELASLIEKVSGLAAELTSVAASYTTSGRTKRLSDLGFTSRQVEIARLCAAGAPSKEIGFHLGIAESTVKNHLAVIYRKLGVKTRMSFLRYLTTERIKME